MAFYDIIDYGVDEIYASVFRQILYDHQFPNGNKLVINDDFISVANKWEIVVGRMYFTSGLGMIWKYMLEQLVEPLTLREWISRTINNSEFDWNLEEPLSSVLSECIYDYRTREDMISVVRREAPAYSIEYGLKVILSVYNRFADRTDFGDEKEFFTRGEENQSISLNEFFSLIKEYKDKPIKELIFILMKHWLVEQHGITAFNKLLQGRDGFYYELIDGRYIKKWNYDIGFQEIRMVELTQVMRDLDML